MKFVCKNKNCKKYDIVEEYFSTIYHYEKGEMISNHSFCPQCGEKMLEINENENIPPCEKNLEIGKYTMASPEQRKEILKKRSHLHFEKHIKEYKEEKIRNEVKKFRSAGK